ncbi:DUF1499 domain-containing protein [Thermodesulfobacteriota bacterium]
MKKMIFVIPAIIVALIIALAVLSFLSRKMPENGMVNGRLRPCPDTPNCVNSEYEGKSFVKPLRFNGSPQEAWQRVKDIIQEMGGSLEVEEKEYLHAVFTSRIFRFQDDVELRVDRDNSRIHIRSSSRIGYSDLGQNRKRARRIRVGFQKNNQR